jgi:hypothetical protein
MESNAQPGKIVVIFYVARSAIRHERVNANALNRASSVRGEASRYFFCPFPGFQGELEFADMLGNVFISCGELRLLGGIAIFLSVVGLPGMVALAGSQRTKELALRLALGASHCKVFFSVLPRAR